MKDLSTEQQVSAYLEKAMVGWTSAEEQDAWLGDMSDEALDQAIATITALIA